jgi:hypothetical protein
MSDLDRGQQIVALIGASSIARARISGGASPRSRSCFRVKRKPTLTECHLATCCGSDRTIDDD